jgi:putative nucleotidyltransferase with HDIG domain
MEIPGVLRQSVRSSLPEVEEIGDEELREKVVDAWALALAETDFESLDDIPCSGVPEAPELPHATQAHHLRATAKLAVAMGEAMEELLGPLGMDRDELLAGGLCHDLGKPYEYSPSNRARWEGDTRIAGKPAIRHPVYGVHVALTVGLPENVAHIVGAHSSLEGQFVTRSLACAVVAYADHSFWKILAGAGVLRESAER